MKKYTKRFRENARVFRFAKNCAAILYLIAHAISTLTGHEPVADVVAAAGTSLCIAVIGEVIFNGWMTIAETAESIQENKDNNETI